MEERNILVLGLYHKKSKNPGTRNDGKKIR